MTFDKSTIMRFFSRIAFSMVGIIVLQILILVLLHQFLTHVLGYDTHQRVPVSDYFVIVQYGCRPCKSISGICPAVCHLGYYDFKAHLPVIYFGISYLAGILIQKKTKMKLIDLTVGTVILLSLPFIILFMINMINRFILQ